ncbi:MAG: 50S ribosomal protein L17 [Candidatus Aenigmarchaeota archaeon]|nr:50S ribosomal protein L17 [Candidatus Aenigmarchaeota archaeon]
MRHHKAGKKLGRLTGPRRALIKSLATSLIIYEKIKTTKAKAKVIRSVVEKLITLGRKNTVTVRRRLLTALPVNAVKKVLEILGPKYASRPGGYTRIIKLGPRQGDGAELVQIELVDNNVNPILKKSLSKTKSKNKK